MAATLLVSIALGQFSASTGATGRTSSVVAYKDMYTWWCGDKEHAGDMLCIRHAKSQQLSQEKDAEKRKAILAELRTLLKPSEDAPVRKSLSEQYLQMKTEFCALPSTVKSPTPLCAFPSQRYKSEKKSEKMSSPTPTGYSSATNVPKQMMAWWCAKPKEAASAVCSRQADLDKLTTLTDAAAKQALVEKLRQHSKTVMNEGGFGVMQAIQSEFCKQRDNLALPICAQMKASEGAKEMMKWYCNGKGKGGPWCTRLGLLETLRAIPYDQKDKRAEVSAQLSKLAKSSSVSPEVLAAKKDFCARPERAASQYCNRPVSSLPRPTLSRPTH